MSAATVALGYSWPMGAVVMAAAALAAYGVHDGFILRPGSTQGKVIALLVGGGLIAWAPVLLVHEVTLSPTHIRWVEGPWWQPRHRALAIGAVRCVVETAGRTRSRPRQWRIEYRDGSTEIVGLPAVVEDNLGAVVAALDGRVGCAPRPCPGCASGPAEAPNWADFRHLVTPCRRRPTQPFWNNPGCGRALAGRSRAAAARAAASVPRAGGCGAMPAPAPTRAPPAAPLERSLSCPTPSSSSPPPAPRSAACSATSPRCRRRNSGPWPSRPRSSAPASPVNRSMRCCSAAA